MDLKFQKILKEEKYERTFCYFLGMPSLKDDFEFAKLKLKLPQLYENIKRKKSSTNLYIFDDQIIICSKGKSLMILPNEKYLFKELILKIIKWGEEIIVLTKHKLFFIQKKSYFLESNGILDICTINNILFILYSNKIEVIGEKKTVYNLIDVNPEKIEPISENKLLLLEKNNLFLVDLEDKTTKHILSSSNLRKVQSIIISSNFYKINKQKPKNCIIYKSEIKINNHCVEKVAYVLTIDCLFYINLTTLEIKDLYFGLEACRLSVSDKYVVLKFYDRVLIYDKFLQSFKRIEGFFSDFVAFGDSFAYLANNFVYFTNNKEKMRYKKSQKNTTILNPFFVKNNYFDLKKKYNYDCSDSESFDDEYGLLLKNNIPKINYLDAEELKFIKINKGFRNYKFKKMSEGHNKRKREYGKKVLNLLENLKKYEDYFIFKDHTFKACEKGNTLPRNVNFIDSQLYKDLLRDYSKIYKSNIKDDSISFEKNSP